jgi:hypothetical protein
MISSDCDFSDFVAAIKDKPIMDVIYLADQEATAAERLFYRNGKNGDQKKNCGKKYASVLKDLVSYMKYDIKLKNSKNEHFDLFASIFERAHANERAIHNH